MSKRKHTGPTPEDFRADLIKLVPQLHDDDVREVLVLAARKVEMRRIEAQGVRDDALNEDEASAYGAELLR